MKTEYKIILIDFDGPINDVSNRYYHVHCNILNIMGFSCNLTKDEYWNFKVNKPNLLFEINNFNSEQRNFYISFFKKIIEEDNFLKYDKIHNDAFNVLEELHHSYDLHLLSIRTNSNSAFNQLKSYKIFNFFKSIDFLPHGNDNSFIKFTAIKALNIKLNSILCFIGDTEIDINASELLKIPSYSVLSGIRSDYFLSRYPYTKIYKNILEIKNEIL